MHQLTRLRTVFPLIVTFFLASISYAASFDCAKAGSDIERRICANEQISSLDSDLASSYKSAIANEPNLKESQLAWIKERNKCSDDECIVNLYKERISFLTNIHNQQRVNDTIKSEANNLAVDLRTEKQEKEEQKSLEAMAEAQALRDELKQGTEQDQREKNASITLAIVSCVLIFIVFLVYKIFIYLKNKGKLALAKSAIKKKYKELRVIDGSEIDESKFSNSHIKDTKINSGKILRTEVFFLSIPYADINSTHACNWTGQKGVVDEGLYSNAMQTYQLAEQQWRIAHGAAHRANSRPDSTEFISVGPAPSRPNKGDFITYHAVNGSSRVSLKHGVRRLLSEITFSGRNSNVHSINLDRFSSTLDKVYNEVLFNILSGNLKKSPDARLINFESPANDRLYDIISQECVDALHSDASSSIGSRSRNISLGAIESDLARSDTSLNIVLTISSLKSDKFIITLHDYLTPDVVLEKIVLP
jgi:uncharacterized protein